MVTFRNLRAYLVMNGKKAILLNTDLIDTNTIKGEDDLWRFVMLDMAAEVERDLVDNLKDISVPMDDKIEINGIYQHFKRELLSEEEKSTNKYLVQVIAIGEHTETSEPLVIYQELDTGKVWVRPYSMFTSEVDKSKYPTITQNYRFERKEN